MYQALDGQVPPTDWAARDAGLNWRPLKMGKAAVGPSTASHYLAIEDLLSAPPWSASEKDLHLCTETLAENPWSDQLPLYIPASCPIREPWCDPGMPGGLLGLYQYWRGRYIPPPWADQLCPQRTPQL